MRKVKFIFSIVFNTFFSFGPNISNGYTLPKTLMSVLSSSIFLFNVLVFSLYKFWLTYFCITSNCFFILTIFLCIFSNFNLFSLYSGSIISYILSIALYAAFMLAKEYKWTPSFISHKS